MTVYGVLVGMICFLCIGIFHPIVIYCEYHFSYRIWWVFLLAGLGLIGASLFAGHIVLASALAVAGFSCLWSILELFEQHKRVERGWFPANPKHHPQVFAEPCKNPGKVS